ncbi:MAG: plasmid recombination protein [Clostridia bacterium]|nr:plasmid recombination protein [Clostridia bacterium]
MKKIQKPDDIGKIENENERQESYTRIGRETIDVERTHNNYHIVPAPDTRYIEFINNRIKEVGVKRKVKDDAVRMATFVIGAKGDYFKDMPPETEREFFTDCVDFIARQMGKENIISAIVHKDETSPHIHINVVPITPDNRLCAKYYFNGKMSEWQTKVYEEVGKKWNLERGKEGSDAKHVDPKTYNKVVKQATADARAENEDLKEANAAARDYLDRTIEQTATARAERDQIIAERDKEADYSQALKDAKDGKIARGKREMKDQIVALTVENKRLENENAILAKDNGDLFKEYQKEKANGQKADVAKKAMLAVREHEPEAYARTFFKATGVLQPFIELFSAPIPLPRNRLREIEREIEEEKRQEQQAQAENNRSKYYWGK